MKSSSNGAAARVGLMVIPGTLDALEVEESRLRPGMDAAARVRADEIMATIPRLASLPDLSICGETDRLSHALSIADWFSVARTIQEALQGDAVDAIVVTHGTNNLEELAYFLSLIVRSEKPIVVTGAMLPWNSAGSDGRWNLINAIRVAASSSSVGRGVVVVLGREIFAARSVTKMSTVAMSAFSSPGSGPIGRLENDKAVYHDHSPQGRLLDLPSLAPGQAAPPRVDIVISYVGADGAVVEACVANGAAGLVTAAGGGGVVTPLENAALLRAAAAGVVVCQASRVAGGVAQLTNERLDSGFVAAGDLSPWKARILLMLALAQSRDIGRIREYFGVY